jgi:hypothetical protein
MVAAADLVERIAHHIEEVLIGVENRSIGCELDPSHRPVERVDHRAGGERLGDRHR